MHQEQYPQGATTQRLIRRVRARRVRFAPVGASAGELLAAWEGLGRPEVIYLVGRRPIDGWRPWAHEGIPPGWELGEHYYENASAPVMRYQRRDHDGPDAGARLEVHSADAWYMGVGRYTVDDAEGAWALLAIELPKKFPGAVLWNTPAATGRDLWLRAIEPGKAWPVLPPSLLELVRESAPGQGRAELLEVSGELSGLYEYDGRLMYAALASWGLPGGIPTWCRGDQLGTVDDYAPARYQVKAQVPQGWPHNFGLLGTKDGPENWRYPKTPGERFVTWCDGAEAFLARRAGWELEITEALVWPRYSGKGPLSSWANKLIALRAELEHPTPPYELARAAVRSLILHTIGSLASSSHRVTRFAETAAELPAEHRRTARPEPTGGFSYPVDLPARWSTMQHPELAAAIWGRGRARLCAAPRRVGALHATGRVVAFRTDAIYTEEPQTWGDDGRAGSFRLKRGGPGPHPTPRTTRELLDLRDRL